MSLLTFYIRSTVSKFDGVHILIQSNSTSFYSGPSLYQTLDVVDTPMNIAYSLNSESQCKQKDSEVNRKRIPIVGSGGHVIYQCVWSDLGFPTTESPPKAELNIQ